MNLFILWFFKLTAIPIVFLYFKLRVITAEKRKPKIKGRTLFVSNHLDTIFDAVAICLSYPFKSLYHIAARNLFKLNWFMRFFLPRVGGIPAEQISDDVSSVTAAIKLLEKEKAVVIFPEGRVSKTSETLKFYPGATIIAAKTDPTIIPVYHFGKRGWLKRATTVLGNPFKLSEHFDLDNVTGEKIKEMTDFIRERVMELKKLIPQKVVQREENRKGGQSS
ncbi:MAG: 1-acyl-sn-glycerol-3-phosphate acyltransferase [Firmicutes bacterium]|nr:1-acyl-sn-glycerol-3-phosphate acyltransferase [Bacillota bacterium]